MRASEGVWSAARETEILPVASAMRTAWPPLSSASQAYQPGEEGGVGRRRGKEGGEEGKGRRRGAEEETKRGGRRGAHPWETITRPSAAHTSRLLSASHASCTSKDIRRGKAVKEIPKRHALVHVHPRLEGAVVRQGLAQFLSRLLSALSTPDRAVEWHALGPRLEEAWRELNIDVWAGVESWGRDGLRGG